MGKGVVVVELELHPLLEVDEIELDLVGAVLQGEARDHRVHERRLARARLAGDQAVLARALAELEELELFGAGGAEGREHLVGRAPVPPLAFGRGDAVERHDHPLGRLRTLAHPLDDPREHVVGWSLFHRQRPLRPLGVLPGVGAVFEGEHRAVLLDVGQ